MQRTNMVAFKISWICKQSRYVLLYNVAEQEQEVMFLSEVVAVWTTTEVQYITH